MILWGLVLLGLGAIGWGMYSAFQMLHPEPRVFPEPEPLPAYAIASLLTHAGKRFEAWILESPAPRGLLITCHGYRGSRLQLLGMAEGLRRRGYTVMVWDFAGHGARPGRCTFGLEEARDLQSLLRWRDRHPPLAALPLGVVGLSMGGAAACLAATKAPQIRALALDSTYAHLYPIVVNAVKARHHLPRIPWAWITWAGVQLALRARLSRVDPAAVARSLTQPLLLIHSRQDQAVPLADAETLLAAWRGPTESWIDPRAAHAGLYAADPDAYVTRLAEFFDRWLSADGRS